MLCPEVSALTPQLLQWRRTMHQNPELSFQEYETTDFIERTLRSFGVSEIARPCKTGLIATIRGTGAGTPATLGIRGDIDALAIDEKADIPFASQHSGVMHACGHDGHAAMLLAAAKLLHESRESFCGEVRFFFQHAEELPPGGAIEMVRAGAADGIDAVLGLHLSSVFPTGTFGVRSGMLTSNVDRFDIKLLGKAGHCSYPEQCLDVVPAGAQLISALQTIISRRIGATDPAVISICQVTAGNSYNIIPDEITLTGTTRCFGPDARRFLRSEMERITQGVALAAGLRYDFQWQEGYPTVINDDTLCKAATDVITRRFGAESALSIGPLMPGEDFQYFADAAKCPGFFVEVGTRCAEKHCDQPHHNPLYCMDEDALPLGAQYLVDMTRTLLDGSRSCL